MQNALFTLPIHLPPAVHQNQPAPSVSRRYGQVRTDAVLEALVLEGYTVVSAAAHRGKSCKFGKHQLTLRHVEASGSGYAPQIVVVNSHDGSTAYRLYIGLSDSSTGLDLIVGAAWGKLRVRHTSRVALEVVAATRQLTAESPKLEAVVQRMRARMLSPDEQLALASRALLLRFREDRCPVQASDLLCGVGEPLHSRPVWDVFQTLRIG